MHCYAGAALPCAEIMFQSRTENASIVNEQTKNGYESTAESTKLYTIKICNGKE